MRRRVSPLWVVENKGQPTLSLSLSLIQNHTPPPSTNQQNKQNKQEEDAYDDVVRLPFVDSYYNLSVKTAALLRWPEQQVRKCVLRIC